MMANARPKVHGDRTCLKCQGICHEDSLRSKVPKGYGFRSHYFCSWRCFKNYIEQKFFGEYREICERQNMMDEYEENLQKSAQETFDRSYEFVDVIAR